MIVILVVLPVIVDNIVFSPTIIKFIITFIIIAINFKRTHPFPTLTLYSRYSLRKLLRQMVLASN